MFDEYIKNGTANCGLIASAVRFRKLQPADIEKLCAMPEVRSAFIGDSFPQKNLTNTQWNEAYLDSIHGYFTTYFNRDYLMYLAEVAAHVANPIAVKRSAGKSILMPSTTRQGGKKGVTPLKIIIVGMMIVLIIAVVGILLRIIP